MGCQVLEPEPEVAVDHHNFHIKCLGAPSELEQLFQHQLFPSSFDQPKTAFTLDVLDYYGIDAMECKTSAQSFFQKLRRVTNNAFPDEVPVRSSFNCI
jgi:CxC2 like cysteine cluster associated with KDZ transposases